MAGYEIFGDHTQLWVNILKEFKHNFNNSRTSEHLRNKYKSFTAIKLKEYKRKTKSFVTDFRKKNKIKV